MLPGFRFLFAAVVLSVSTVIFGLGAAALLRAAHEQFASLPVWKAPPETVFAQRTEPTPTLAMLNVEATPANPLVSVSPETGITIEQQPQKNAPVATDKDEALSTPGIVGPAASAPVVEPPAQARIEPNSPAATEAANVATPSPKAPDQATSTAASEPPPAAEATVASTPSPQADTTPAAVVALPAAPEPAPPQTADVASPATPAEPPAPAISSDAKPETVTATAPSAATEEPKTDVAMETVPAVAAEQPATPAAAPEPSAKPAETIAAAPVAAPAPTPVPTAPVKTAMLDHAPSEPAALPPPVAIQGRIPLPRSRALALARGRQHHLAVNKRSKVATRAVRPRVIRQPVRPVAPQAPIQNSLFPFE